MTTPEDTGSGAHDVTVTWAAGGTACFRFDGSGGIVPLNGGDVTGIP